MPITHVTKLLAVDDAKCAKLTADAEGAAAPTYGALVDLPGIKQVALTLEFESRELRGDNRRLDQASFLVGITLGFTQAKLSLDAAAIMAGGAVVDSGTAPAQKATWARGGADVVPQFKFEAKTPNNGIDVVGGDGHLVAYKLTATALPLGLAEEDYQTFDIEAAGAFLTSSGKLFDLVLNETGAAIA